MTVMGSWARPSQQFYHWWTPNCGGYRIQIEAADWAEGHFTAWEPIGRELWRNRAYSFFQNRECEYFPCHEVAKPDDFNCLFCFCPLYHLGKDCGGSPTFTDEGVKDCSLCTLPHSPDSYGTITARLKTA